MSLQSQTVCPPRRHEQEVICLDSDGDDDVQHTAGPSRASSVKSNQMPPARHPSLTRPVSPPLPQSKTNTNSVRGLPDDRFKMEQERIARANLAGMKRGIDETGSPGRSGSTGGVSGRPIKTQRTEEVPPKSFYGGDSTSRPESPDSGSGTLGFKESELKKMEPAGPRVRLGSEVRSGTTVVERGGRDYGVPRRGGEENVFGGGRKEGG